MLRCGIWASPQTLKRPMECNSPAMWWEDLYGLWGGQIPILPQRAFILSPHLSDLSLKNSNLDIVVFL